MKELYNRVKHWLWLHLPCVTGNELTRKDAELYKERHAKFAAKHDLDELRKELPRLKDDMARICDKMFRTTVYQDPCKDSYHGYRWRFMLDISHLFENTLMFGNDQHFLEYAADWIKCNVLQELRRHNFRRMDSF